MSRLVDIQQAFVRRYMDGGGVIGVRVKQLDGRPILLVEVDDPKALELPATFRGLPVAVQRGHRAVLAYA